jgi:hypothetical protein
MKSIIIVVVLITLIVALVSATNSNYCNVRNPTLTVETVGCGVYKITCSSQGANRFRLWKNSVAGTYLQQIDASDTAVFDPVTVTGSPTLYICTAGIIGSDCRPLQAEKRLDPCNNPSGCVPTLTYQNGDTCDHKTFTCSNPNSLLQDSIGSTFPDPGTATFSPTSTAGGVATFTNQPVSDDHYYRCIVPSNTIQIDLANCCSPPILTILPGNTCMRKTFTCSNENTQLQEAFTSSFTTFATFDPTSTSGGVATFANTDIENGAYFRCYVVGSSPPCYSIAQQGFYTCAT